MEKAVLARLAPIRARVLLFYYFVFRHPRQGWLYEQVAGLRQLGHFGVDLVLNRLEQLHSQGRLTHEFECRYHLDQLLGYLSANVQPQHADRLAKMLEWDQICTSGYDSLRWGVLEGLACVGTTRNLSSVTKCWQQTQHPDYESRKFGNDYSRMVDREVLERALEWCTSHE